MFSRKQRSNEGTKFAGVHLAKRMKLSEEERCGGKDGRDSVPPRSRLCGIGAA
jgi:hypothetical protein